MKPSELSNEYERWVKMMQEKGLSYGPADVFIAQLEAANGEMLEALECAYNSIRRGYMYEIKDALCGEDVGTERDMVRELLKQAIREETDDEAE